MCQQTQVGTVIPYYERFMKQFPTVQALADATEPEVLSRWEGLGYYRRARMLHSGAKLVVKTGFPGSAKEWRAVPGVGAYTAGAIASITLGESVPVVDGNVERVFARLTANSDDRAALHRAAWAWASEQVPTDKPGDWNQAVMELGATVCTPARPACESCPVSRWCEAYSVGEPERFPRPKERAQTVLLKDCVVVCVCGERFGLRQIPAGEWWEGMWQFCRGDRPPFDPLVRWDLGMLTHAITKHRITLRAELWKLAKEEEGLQWFDPEALDALPMPAPQRKLLKRALEVLTQR